MQAEIRRSTKEKKVRMLAIARGRKSFDSEEMKRGLQESFVIEELNRLRSDILRSSQ